MLGVLLWPVLPVFIVAVIAGAQGLIDVVDHWSDRFVEQWEGTSADGLSWECTHIPGSNAMCSRESDGTLEFYYGTFPEPSLCMVRELWTFPEDHDGHP